MDSRGRSALVWILVSVVLLVALGLGWVAYRRYAQEKEPGGATFERDDAAARAMVLGAFRSLPSDALGLGTIPNATAFGQALRASWPGQLLADARVREHALQVVASVTEPRVASAFREALLGVDEISGLGIRSVSVALVPLASPEEPAGLMALLACDDPARVKAWLLDRLKGEAAAEEPAPPRTHGGVPYECRGELCFAERANSLLLGVPAAALEKLVDGPGPAGPAGDDSPVAQAIAGADARTEGLFLFADLARMVAGAQAAASASSGAPPQAVLDLLGVPGLASLAAYQSAAGAAFQDRIQLRFDPTKAGLLGSLLALEGEPPGFDRLLPADYSSHAFGRLPDLAAAWDRVLQVLRATLPSQEVERIDQGLAAAKMFLGVDIRDDVLASLGGEWGWAYHVDPARLDDQDPRKALGAQRLLLVLGVRDQARIERLLARLDSMGLPIVREQLADGTIRSAAMPVPGGPTVAVALARGRLALGLREDEVRSAIEPRLPVLADDPAYQAARRSLPPGGQVVFYSRPPGDTIRQMIDLGSAKLAAALCQERLQQAERDLERIAQAVESYRLAHEEREPPPGTSLEELKAQLGPTGEPLPERDAWGEPYGYTADASGYVLWSRGSDRKPERDWSPCRAGCADLEDAIHTQGGDVVYANGGRVRFVSTEPGRQPVGETPRGLAELQAALAPHLDRMPAAVGVARTSAGMLEIDYKSAVSYGAVLPVAAAAALPRLSGPGAGSR